jgi:hypothetical protein
MFWILTFVRMTRIKRSPRPDPEADLIALGLHTPTSHATDNSKVMRYHTLYHPWAGMDIHLHGILYVNIKSHLSCDLPKGRGGHAY